MLVSKNASVESSNFNLLLLLLLPMPGTVRFDQESSFLFLHFFVRRPCHQIARHLLNPGWTGGQELAMLAGWREITFMAAFNFRLLWLRLPLEHLLLLSTLSTVARA